MAFEATLVTKYSEPVGCIVSNTTGIEKGTILKMADPFTVSASNGAVDTFGGILAAEKIASNGVTIASVYRDGIFKVKISGSVTVGDALVTDSVANHLKSATALTQFAVSGTRIFGTALETGTTGETILMELRPVAVQGA